MNARRKILISTQVPRPPLDFDACWLACLKRARARGDSAARRLPLLPCLEPCYPPPGRRVPEPAPHGMASERGRRGARPPTRPRSRRGGRHCRVTVPVGDGWRIGERSVLIFFYFGLLAPSVATGRVCRRPCGWTVKFDGPVQ